MNRDEQLKFCKVCLNRQMDAKRGLLCGLTQDIARFENECSEFAYDEDAAKLELHQADISEAVSADGQRDMLFGALWCIGGLAATIADFGFIFWGAIVFGAIQFIRGATA